jgi:hypothetical protein
MLNDMFSGHNYVKEVVPAIGVPPDSMEISDDTMVHEIPTLSPDATRAILGDSYEQYCELTGIHPNKR